MSTPLPILTTKLYIPPARPTLVPRLRLIACVNEGLTRPLTLISAPAGFGKTTLVSEWRASAAGRDTPLAWLSLDNDDNDPMRFLTHLVAALGTLKPGLGEAALALLPQPAPPQVILTGLINDLSELETPVVLALDDYHVITSQPIQDALIFLLDHLPPQMHLVLLTRADPPLPLARLRARDQLAEIRAADLRFTTEEAAAFLNQVMGLNLSPEDVAALEARTEGWIAGLQLAALSMKGRSDIAGFVKAFTGSHVYVAEYLVEEVLQRQREDVQTFLLQTSILGRLNAGLCEAVSGRPDSQAMLKELFQANLFVLPLDDEGQWYRYHHLFEDLLQARLRQDLPPDAIATLHQRAAAWYEQAGMTPDAIEHALAAADYSHVVKLVEKNALPTILQAHVRTVEGWLQAIPREHVEQSPRVNMAFLWLHLLRGTSDQALPYLEHLRAIFSASGTGDGNPSLQGEWLAIQSKLLGMKGRPVESRDLANRALQILPEAEAHVRSMALVNLATAYQQMLDYDHAAETFQMIVREAEAAGNFALEILGRSGQAQMVLQQGQLHLGFEIALQGIHRLESTGKSTPFSATLYGELGQIHYHWHQLDQAQRYFLRSSQTSGQSGYSDPEIYHHVMLSRMFQMEADWDASAREMQKASDLARMMPPAMVREEVISQQVRVHLAFDRFADVQAALKADRFTFDGVFGFPDLAPGSKVTHPVGLLYNSALRVVLFQARAEHDLVNLKRGIDLAALVLAGELQCRHIPIALETLLLRSQMRAALGDDRDSLADVAEALELAEPEGFISIFLEEGAPMAEALTTLLQRSLPGAVQPGYVRDILAAFPGTRLSKGVRGEQPIPNPQTGKGADAVDESLAPVEPLTPRELEVLQLIAAGDSNQTIAGKLVITLSAVKKHTGNIFGKLNVNSRTQAVARARQLGLLSADPGSG